MSRRSAPKLRTGSACGNHRPYRSRQEAVAKASWHPVGACPKCQAGKVWHVFRCLNHWHVGHRSVRRMQEEMVKLGTASRPDVLVTLGADTRR